ncbi:sensor histidine kinase [Streptomyces goshikiensis]|uniref:sensor histidine kinase n=1 Tax=Streptomyces goshikiensis TaxID=1942 RepID=UPI0036CAC7C4
MSTAMSRTVTAAPRAPGGRPRSALVGDVLITVVAALELLTLHGQLDRTAALVCPPALIALMLRRRLPVTVLLATLPSMATGFLWLAPMAAMYTVASCAVRRRVVVGAGAALFAATLWAGYTVGAEAMTWSDHLIVVQVALMFSLGPAGLGLLARTRSELRAHVAELSASQARGRRLEAERAVARERTRMAREMHDTVSYHLGLIAAQSGALWSTAPDDTVREDAETIRRHSADALAELRDIVGVLRHAAGRGDEGDPARLANLGELVREARLDAVLDLDLGLPDGRGWEGAAAAGSGARFDRLLDERDHRGIPGQDQQFGLLTLNGRAGQGRSSAATAGRRHDRPGQPQRARPGAVQDRSGASQRELPGLHPARPAGGGARTVAAPQRHRFAAPERGDAARAAGPVEALAAYPQRQVHQGMQREFQQQHVIVRSSTQTTRG